MSSSNGDITAPRALSVIGLGKLGSCMAAAMAHKGFDVVGVDVDEAVVSAMAAARPPVLEPGLEEMLAGSAARVSATTDSREAVLATDATFIIVPTPSEADGSFSSRYVEAVAAQMGPALRAKGAYHLVVLTSTVLPGTTQRALIEPLEAGSGLSCGESFGVCYSPTLVALGTVLRDFLHPEVVLVGESDPSAGDVLVQLYRRLLDTDTPAQRMAIAAAELAKVALNTYITTKITFANMLAEMCERVPGGDVDKVTGALGLDTRVGPRYLAAGMGYGGPCFPRDNDALRSWAASVGAPAHLPVGTDELNATLERRMLEKIEAHCQANPGPVAVLGLSYKPGTPVLEASPALGIAHGLVERGLDVVAYDPLSHTFAGDLDGRLRLAGTLAEALAVARVVVVASPDPAFAELADDDFLDEAVVFDCWRLLKEALHASPRVRYHAPGLGPAPVSADDVAAPASSG